jgi:hypothetical protein
MLIDVTLLGLLSLPVEGSLIAVDGPLADDADVTDAARPNHVCPGHLVVIEIIGTFQNTCAL